MSLSHRAHPARTLTIPKPVMTLATFRFFTAAVRRGPAAGPTSTAEGPMKPTNRKADPTQRTPATMCRNRNTRKNGTAAITWLPPFRQCATRKDIREGQGAGSGNDVLVQPEHVVRVERSLQRDQAFVFRVAVDRANHGLSGLDHVVDVVAARREWLERVHGVSSPREVSLVQVGILP